MVKQSIAVCVAVAAAVTAANGQAVKVKVELEHEVYTYAWPGNGADAFWCTGNTTIVRHGRDVYATGLEVLPKAANPNNVRWLLFAGRGGGKLRRIADGGKTHEREPSPIGCFKDGRLLLTTNPIKADLKNATPRVLEFTPGKNFTSYRTLTPRWAPGFIANQHTYRSFSVDAANNEFILFYQYPPQNDTYWSFYSKGKWVSQGKIPYPRVMYGTRGAPLRTCYAATQITDGAVHYLGVSDVQEPIEKFRGMTSGWVFRRLYDNRTGKFHKWVQIADHDDTDGYVYPLDIFVEKVKTVKEVKKVEGAKRADRVHILWYEREISSRPAVRKKFLRGRKQRIALNYSIIRGGKVVSTKPIVEWKQGDTKPKPGRSARFHVTPKGKFHVVYYASKNYIVELRDGRPVGRPTLIPLAKPLRVFMTPGIRSGSTPSQYLDILGELRRGRGTSTVRYARVLIR